MDIVKEMLDKHNNDEVVAYLSKTMNGIVQNYRIALQSGRSDALWGSFGDIMLVNDFLREIKKRNDARDAMKES